MNLKNLNLLADDGMPLALTVSERGDRVWISRNGMDAVKLWRTHVIETPEEMLGRILAHHPQVVTLNGKPIPRTPPPGAARALIYEPHGYNAAQETFEQYVPLGDAAMDPANRPLTRPYNAIVGGVKCYLKVAIPDWEHEQSVYFSRTEGPAPRHHRLLRRVEMEAHTEVWPGEIRELAQRGQSLVIIEGSELDRRVQQRRREMRERTKALSGMPPVYGGGGVSLAPDGRLRV